MPIFLVKCGKVRWKQPVIDLHVFLYCLSFPAGLFFQSFVPYLLWLSYVIVFMPPMFLTYIGCKICFRWGLGLELLN